MNGKKQNQKYMENHYYEDEISLVHLWLVMLRWKYLIAGIFLICVFLGISYAWLKDPVYRYTTVIELARFGDGKSVESTDSVRARVNRIFIPMFRTEMRDLQNETGYQPPRASARIPEGGARLLEIYSDNIEDRQDEIRSLHERLFSEIKTEQDFLVLMENESLLLEKQTVTAEINRLETEKKRLQEQIADTRKRLDSASLHQGRAMGEARDEARAMTMLLIQSEVEKAHEKLAGLEEELYRQLPAREDKLNLRLTGINNQLDRISFTKIRIMALASEHPVSRGKIIIVALSMILGAMIGVFAAFFAEFLSRAHALSTRDSI